MPAPPFVAARVTPEMETVLRTLAEREQITGSALVRQLVEVKLRMSAKEELPKLVAREKVSRDPDSAFGWRLRTRSSCASRRRPGACRQRLRFSSGPLAPSEPSAATQGEAAGI